MFVCLLFVCVLISVDDNTVKIWDAVSGDIKNTLQGHSYWVNSVAISPDGSTIVSGGEYSNNTIQYNTIQDNAINVYYKYKNSFYYCTNYYYYLNY